jgi:UDP-N-acetylglucosamine diphosphorylase / glucose-1-phosphate thymidylyltransferase / UDP-N-acetylgalactosamine diphosphorylase / glucosamine-1-phosphate N-acetyltransferase / galactosamine-1-phosphate N-acetyltransferase
MQLTFHSSLHHLDSLIDKNEIPASALEVLGQPLIIRNVNIATKVLAIDTIKIPDQFPNVLRLVQDKFPLISVEEFHDDINNNNNNGNNLIGTTKPVVIIGGSSTTNIEIPINSLIRYSGKSSNNNNNNNNNNDRGGSANFLVDSIIYPWDFLNAIEKVLQQDVTQTSISPNASVAKSSIINGPCIIEDNVTIDDFCKINGPTYIGEGCSIGTGSLVRECMIGSNTKIGFSCETGRTYFAGDDEIAHLNIILDSVIGRNVWFGGFSRTANVLLTKRDKNITYQIGNGKTVDLGTHHFGSIVGNNCTIGTSVVLLPGRYVPAHTVIQDETTFAQNIAVK